jgi:hypothetical protein
LHGIQIKEKCKNEEKMHAIQIKKCKNQGKNARYSKSLSF